MAREKGYTKKNFLKGIVVEKDEARKDQAIKASETEAPVRTRRAINGQD